MQPAEVSPGAGPADGRRDLPCVGQEEAGLREMLFTRR